MQNGHKSHWPDTYAKIQRVKYEKKCLGQKPVVYFIMQLWTEILAHRGDMMAVHFTLRKGQYLSYAKSHVGRVK